MRVILAAPGLSPGPWPATRAVTDRDLAQAYSAPAPSWWRANMIGSLDGAATGADGRSGSLGTPGDRRVYGVLRALADAVVVGAGTARTEGYGATHPAPGGLGDLRAGRPAAPPLIVVSGRGELPPRLRPGGAAVETATPSGQVLLATSAAAVGRARAVEELGAERVLVVGDRRVDLRALRAALAERGWGRVLLEGGPRLLAGAVAAGIVDELCLTISPRLVAGDGRRILTGGPVEVPARPAVLIVDDDGTLLGRWFLGAEAPRPSR